MDKEIDELSNEISVALNAKYEVMFSSNSNKIIAAEFIVLDKLKTVAEKLGYKIIKMESLEENQFNDYALEVKGLKDV